MNQISVTTHTDDTGAAGPVTWLNIVGTPGNDRIAGGFGADVISGKAGDDYIIDTVGENQLYGDEGDDELVGHGTFTGGHGNDIIRGDGDFRFCRGDGHDTIANRGIHEHLSDPGTLGESILHFGPGIDPSSIRVERYKSNLVLKLDDNDSVTIENWFSDPNAKLGRIEFDSGKSWDRTTFARMKIQITGTPGNDTVEGTDQDDVINALDGNDFIFDLVGDNLIFGGAGNDTIMARGAIHGGTGNDNIIAGGDNSENIYYYECADGCDTIHVNGPRDSSPRGGHVVFLDPMTMNDLWFRRQADNLAITVVGSDQGVTISNWFLGTGNQVKDFRLGNTKTMPSDRVDTLVQAMAHFDAPLAAGSTVTENARRALAPILAASWSPHPAG
jgi:Ca2+-binding RTX toxin-like protein